MEQQHSYSEQIKQQAITPSESSWEKLSEKLSANERHQKGNKWVFMKYAAAILMLISVGFYFLQPKAKIIEGDLIVAPMLKEEFIKSPVLNQTPERLIANPVKIPPIITTYKTPSKFVKVNINKVDEVVVFQEITRIKKPEIAVKNNEKSRAITKEKSIIVIASLDEVTDSEIEQLLNNATTNFKMNLLNLNKDVVSANTLLLEVEDDINKDFKQKMFETIVKSLSNFKEVVADNGN